MTFGYTFLPVLKNVEKLNVDPLFSDNSTGILPIFPTGGLTQTALYSLS